MKQKRMQRKGVENTEQKVAAKVDENEEAEEAGQENSDLTVGDEAEKNAQKGLEEWGRRRRRRRRRDRRRRDRRRRDRRRRERRRRSRRRRSRRRGNPNDCRLGVTAAGTNAIGCSGLKEVRSCRLTCNAGYYGAPKPACTSNNGHFTVAEGCMPNGPTSSYTEVVVVAVRSADQAVLNSIQKLRDYCPDGTLIF